MIPSWYALVLLSLAAYRTWRLLAEDTILAPIRRRLVRGERVSEFVSCPWCLGAWVAVAWWGCWWAWPHTTLIVSVPFVVSALTGAFAMLIGALED
jgi:hypothetical protein